MTVSMTISIRSSRARRISACALALAAGLLALSAQADDTSPARKAQNERVAPATGSRIVDREQARRGPTDLDEVLVIGAINDPADADAPEDTSVPALPSQQTNARTADAEKASRRGRSTTGSRIPDGRIAELEPVHIVGAINDPADADAPEDVSVPALPMLAADDDGR